MKMETTLLNILLFGVVLVEVDRSEGHGRLMNPPARNCMWRFGFSNPVNYNDNELFCGGFTTQIHNRGKCGVCGDNYQDPTPRKHEIGGLYANRIIARQYYSGQDITVRVDLTANHKGHFLFKLCPVTSENEEVTQDCLDRNPLKIVKKGRTAGSFRKFLVHPDDQEINLSLRLPSGLTCERCVFQWTYVTGNTWGTCPDGTEKTGCGPQETFVNCADIKIVPATQDFWLDPSLTSSSRWNPNTVWYKDHSKEGSPMAPLIVSHQVCVATDAYEKIPGIQQWCQQGCMRYPPYCPENVCRCVKDCAAIGSFSQEPGATQYCKQHCIVYPPGENCTNDKCQCW